MNRILTLAILMGSLYFFLFIPEGKTYVPGDYDIGKLRQQQTYKTENTAEKDSIISYRECPNSMSIPACHPYFQHPVSLNPKNYNTMDTHTFNPIPTEIQCLMPRY